MPKITAIESGEDWADASVEYLVLPDGMVLAKEYYLYLNRDRVGEWISFPAWLKQRGARDPNDDELEVFDEG